MNILLCGDTGFIGRHIALALRKAGHQVTGLRAPRTDGRAPLDFVQATRAESWRPWVDGMDAVVNAVGVLRDTKRRPIQAVHADAPLALFDACVAAGVRRVIQVSALGVDRLPQTYARTKLAAERGLLAHQALDKLDAAILRPSVVFGRGGAGSEMFMRLAQLPLLVMPGVALHARIQPVAVTDVADAVAALVGPQPGWRGVMDCVGPRALTLGEFIDVLRVQQGHGAARHCGLPDWWSHAMAAAGDRVSVSPWSSDTLAMLQVDNVGDAAPFARLLGHPPCEPERMVERVWR
jgi:nucleoside-diphosphate-sugar epimerase